MKHGSEIAAAVPRDDYPNFMALRLLAAASVIFSHAFLIAEGTEKNEPFVRLLGEHNILGIYGVFVFFFISGFLVTQSATYSKSVGKFLWKRMLRVYPALFVCALVTASTIGSAFTRLPLAEFWGRLLPVRYAVKTTINPDHWGWRVDSVSFEHVAADLSRGMNGSLWTINQELNCYLVIAILLALGLLRWWTVLLLALVSLPFMMADTGINWPKWFENLPYLLPCFAFGSAVYFIRHRWGLNGKVAAVSGGLLIVAALLGRLMELFPLLGAYPLLWLATTNRVRLPAFHRMGDISYGLYLYGWPVEMTVRSTLGTHATWWNVAAISLLVAGLLGYASWHLVEKHALKLKGGGIPFLQRKGKARMLPAPGIRIEATDLAGTTSDPR